MPSSAHNGVRLLAWIFHDKHFECLSYLKWKWNSLQLKCRCEQTHLHWALASQIRSSLCPSHGFLLFGVIFYSTSLNWCNKKEGKYKINIIALIQRTQSKQKRKSRNEHSQRASFNFSEMGLLPTPKWQQRHLALAIGRCAQRETEHLSMFVRWLAHVLCSRFTAYTTDWFVMWKNVTSAVYQLSTSTTLLSPKLNAV